MSQSLRWKLGLAVVCAAVIAFVFWRQRPADRPPDEAPAVTKSEPRRFNLGGQLTLWWERIPENVKSTGFQSAETSNIHPADYVGPESCKKCHPRNYHKWESHPHRKMNALATAENVVGDFSGRTSINYLGGTATFSQVGKKYYMRLTRGKTRLKYLVTQTIGSRFYQYYVGKLLTSTGTHNRVYYNQDHVLPFGFWLDRREWVPVVHVTDELPDGRRVDPFNLAANPTHGKDHFSYSTGCNSCHTTFPLGDMLIRKPELIGRHAPVKMHWSMSNYLSTARTSFWNSKRDPGKLPDPKLMEIISSFIDLEAPGHAVTLGVSCEACHLGSREHAGNPKVLPKFFPQSPHLHLEARKGDFDFSRNHQNVNWACGRCHAGNRPQYAAGMATWNSTEYTDAMRGSCYSKLRCIDCHDPHKPIGKKWTFSPAHNDKLCMKCHQQFQQPEKLAAHTHHTIGSTGSRCMNCHMPRINEGMQDIVRTHMIYSPTNRKMIEANHPNACNQCHVKEPISWTEKYLKKWYGAQFSSESIVRNYPDPNQSVALGWLKSHNEAVRMIGIDVLTRTKSRWALPQLIEALDDPFLLNRQFALKNLESMLGIRLDRFGYKFYMTPDERKVPLERIRRALLRGKKTKKRTAAARGPPGNVGTLPSCG